MDGNNTLQIKAIGVVISTFETRPNRADGGWQHSLHGTIWGLPPNSEAWGRAERSPSRPRHAPGKSACPTRSHPNFCAQRAPHHLGTPAVPKPLVSSLAGGLLSSRA